MEGTLGQSLKKAKRKQVLKIIIISVVTVVMILLLGVKLSDVLVTRNSGLLTERLFLHNRIAEPNIQIDSQVLRSSSFFGGEVVTHRSKNVAGYLVPWSTLTTSYSILRDSIDFNELTPGWQHSEVNSYDYDKQTKQKSATFYHPEIQDYYQGVKNELVGIDQLENRVAEVAISFDKPYSWTDISSKIPKTIGINWLYLYSEILDESEEPTRSEIYGVAIEGAFEDWYQQFLEDLDSYHPSLLEDYLKVGGQSGSEVDILGAMVTGKTEDLAKLSQLSFVRGASIGVTAEIVPYMTPESRVEISD